MTKKLLTILFAVSLTGTLRAAGDNPLSNTRLLLPRKASYKAQEKLFARFRVLRTFYDIDSANADLKKGTGNYFAPSYTDGVVVNYNNGNAAYALNAPLLSLRNSTNESGANSGAGFEVGAAGDVLGFNMSSNAHVSAFNSSTVSKDYASRSAFVMKVVNPSGSGVGSEITFATAPVGSTTLQSRMVIDGTGKVGIGTASPDYRLQVENDQDGSNFIAAKNNVDGANAYSAIRALGQNQSLDLQATSDSYSRPYPGFHSGAVSVIGRAGNGLNIVSGTGDGTAGSYAGIIRFITSPSSITANGDGNDALTRMVILANGNVGIGTINTSQPEKLAVNGSIKCKKVIVSQSGWPDYVFARNYKLRSLTSLEAFIKSYKHLPELPSAKEVEEKGISIGDNQALLLKKVEELTLYMIEANKEQVALKTELMTVKKQLHKLSARLKSKS